MKGPLERVLITCGAGFVVSNVVSKLLAGTDAHLTLLLLADSAVDADRYRQNLLSFIKAPASQYRRVRALSGDVRASGFGLTDLRVLDSDVWLLGTLPFKFGAIRRESLDAALQIANNSIDVLTSYSQIEPVRHAMQLSSLRVAGRNPLRLPESLIYKATPYGNFDNAKRLIESQYQRRLARREFPAPLTVVRLGTLMSEDVRRVGGAVLLLAKEMLGFGRASSRQEPLWADEAGVLRVLPAIQVSQVICQLLNTPPDSTRVVNLTNNRDKVGSLDFAQIILEARGESSTKDAAKKLIRSPEASQARRLHETTWLRSKFGWLLAAECSALDPKTEMLENLLGDPWAGSGGSDEPAAEILRRVIFAARDRSFRTDHVELGASPTY